MEVPETVYTVQRRQAHVQELVFQCIGRPALQVMAGIKPADGDHLVIGEHEIEHIHVLYHAFLVDRLGDDYNSLLNEEAQRHLRGCLPMDLPHLRKDGMGEDAVEAFGQRAP